MAATTARRDVELQQLHDRNYDSHQDTLLARMRTVLGAQEALAAREHDAAYVLRQALVDLAAIAELVADDLPALASREAPSAKTPRYGIRTDAGSANRRSRRCSPRGGHVRPATARRAAEPVYLITATGWFRKADGRVQSEAEEAPFMGQLSGRRSPLAGYAPKLPLLITPRSPPRDTARAMSQENVEAFKHGIEAYNRRDVEALLEVHDPDVEWHPVLQVPLGGEATVYRGHDGIREFVRDLDEAFAEAHIEVSEIRDMGDRLVAIGRLHARGKASGADTESPIGYVADFKNGKAIRIRSWLDPKEALAAGLRE